MPSYEEIALELAKDRNKALANLDKSLRRIADSLESFQKYGIAVENASS